MTAIRKGSNKNGKAGGESREKRWRGAVCWAYANGLSGEKYKREMGHPWMDRREGSEKRKKGKLP